NLEPNVTKAQLRHSQFGCVTDPRGQHFAVRGSGQVSNARLSRSTGMPEGNHVNKLSRYPIVDVVPHTGQRYTTHALGTAATSRRTYAGLRTQHIQHLGIGAPARRSR